MPNDDRESGTKQPVTVFGAGIAGLTAAHELAERGFQVEVIDPDINENVTGETLERGIGGMARSQWVYDIPPLEGAAAGMRRLRAADFLREPLLFRADDPNTPLDKERAATLIDQVAEVIVRRQLEGRDRGLLTIRGTPPPLDAKDARVVYLREELNNRLSVMQKSLARGTQGAASGAPEIKQLSTADVEDILRPRKQPPPAQATPPSEAQPSPAQGTPTALRFRVVNASIFPAEHGFRFFPSFYRHLFDTMKRTPTIDPALRPSSDVPHNLPYRQGLTVFDNLTPSDVLGFARDGKAQSFAISRRPMEGLEVVRRYLQRVLRDMEYTLSDLERFSLKIFKYMTSCSQRRSEEYESLSWGDFIEQRRYSRVSAKHIEFGPQMSAALRGSESDARTQGNITVQLMLDQLRPNAQTDSLLNAPTNGAWFDHWHEYLLSQNVEFRRDKLVSFKNGQNGKLAPVLASGKTASGAYYVIALPLPEAARVAREFLDALAKEGLSRLPEEDDDFSRVIDFAHGRLGGATLAQDLQAACPKGPLQHLSGIQYYFDADIRFWRGHTQYLDSPWGLTSIAQPQFWARRRDSNDPYRGILSVDIGIWDQPFGNERKTAWDCTPDQIATLAWKQIRDHHDNAFQAKYGDAAKIPEPIAYALDQRLAFGDPRQAPKVDEAPFLVNRVCDYRKRPGTLVDNAKKLPEEASKAKTRSGYSVNLGYVLAGTFMRTYTRLTSMEGANESARHAVNALLSVMNVASDRCEIWDPEDNEPIDLQWWKDLDQRLVKERRPHMLDILGYERAMDLGRRSDDKGGSP